MYKFSIIIPNYNEEKYINRCLESIFNQTMNKGTYLQKISKLIDWVENDKPYTYDTFLKQ